MRHYLYSLQMSDFNLAESNDHERRLRELDESIGRRLDQDVGAIGHTTEPNLSEWDIDINALIFSSIGNLLGKAFEFSIQRSSTSPFLLLGLEFFLVPIAVPAATVSGLVELHFRGLSVKLNVPGLSFSNHDWRFEVDMNENDQLVSAWLEEEMFHIAEENIHVLRTEGRQVSKTILMDLDFPGHALSVKRGTKIDIG